MIGKGGGSESEVFGDTANIASRVQSAADPDTVMVSAATNRLVTGMFVVEERGAHQLKGIASPVELFQIVQAQRCAKRSGRFGRARSDAVCWPRRRTGAFVEALGARE